MALICVAESVNSSRPTPILFFSGAAYEADKKRGLEAGANAYVMKPDFDGLLGTIKQSACDSPTHL
jgi:DNA-binding response OmpR family regulator